MTEVISDSQYWAIQELISDPEQVGELSMSDISRLSNDIAAFETFAADREEGLRSEGLDDAAIARFNQAARNAPDPADLLKEQGTAKGPGSVQAEGVKDGAVRAAQGVADAAMDVSVEIGNVLGVDALGEEEDRIRWKQGQAEYREKIATEHMQTFGELPSGAAEFVGEVVPWLFALPSMASNLFRLGSARVIQGGVMGASTNQLMGQDLWDRGFSASIGATIGLLTAAPHVWGWAKKGTAGAFVRGFNNDNLARADMVQTMVREMTGNKSFTFSLGQASGSRTAIGLEVKAADQLTKNRQNESLDVLARHIFNRAEEMSAQGMRPGQISRALKDTLATARTNIYEGASNAWKKEQAALFEEFGDDVVLSGDNYLAKIDKLLGEVDDVFLNPVGRQGSGLQRYRNAVDIEVNPVGVQKNAGGTWQLFDRKNGQWLPQKSRNRQQLEAVARQQNADFGGLDADATLRLMKGLNRMIGGETAVFENASTNVNREYGRALMGNLTGSLEANPANAEAAAAVNTMRQNYSKQMARAQAIDDTVVNLIFGGKKLPKKPGNALDSVLKQEADELAATRDFLFEWNKPLLKELQAMHLQRIARGSLSGKQAAVDGEVAMDKFLTRLEGQMSGAGNAGLGLHSPAVQADLRKTAAALRIIKNKYYTGVAPGGPGVDDLAINIVSRSPEFMARFVTRVLTTGKSFEAGMLDQSFRKALQTVAEAPLGSNLSMQAMVYLTQWTAGAQRDADLQARDAEIIRQQEGERKRIENTPFTVQ